MPITIEQFIKTELQKESNQTKNNITEQELWWLIEHITGKRKTQILSRSHQVLTENQAAQLKQCIHEIHVEHKPLQYILGKVPFGDLEILVKQHILIPRPETEEWVLWLINNHKWPKDKPLNILDLCTGSGCIGLQLAKSFPFAMAVGIDSNPTAIVLAEQNKKLNNIKTT